MSDLDLTRRRISAIIDELERIKREMGPELWALCRQPEDRVPYEIICRIERKLNASMGAQVGGQDTG